MKCKILVFGLLFASASAFAEDASKNRDFTEVLVKAGISSWTGDAKSEDKATAFGLGIRRSFEAGNGFDPYLEVGFIREKLDDQGLLKTADSESDSTLSTFFLAAGGCKSIVTDLAFCGGLGFGSSNLHRNGSSSVLGTPVLDVSLRSDLGSYSLGLGVQVKGYEVAQDSEQKKATDILSSVSIGYKFY